MAAAAPPAAKRMKGQAATEPTPTTPAATSSAVAANSSDSAEQIARDAALAALFTTPRRPTRSTAAKPPESPSSVAAAAAAAAAEPAAAAAAAPATKASRASKRKHVAVEYEAAGGAAGKGKRKAGADGDDDEAMPALEGAAGDEADSDHLTAQAQAKTGVAPPENWEKVYAGIEQMRFREGGIAFNAPVDTVGCAQLANPLADDRTRRFHTLVSLMLSSQTKDPVTAAAMGNLHRHWPTGLTIDNLLATSDATLDSLINKVGFHNRKVQYLKQTAAILKAQYASDIPATLEGLVALPGVGPKMAHLTMQVAWKNTVGIGVDTHVHRISNRLGWVGKKPTSTPEHTRKALEQWLPRDYWGVINLLLVGFGQKVCLPIGPRCVDCHVNALCPTGRANLRYSKDPNKFHEVNWKSGDAHTLHEEGVQAVKTVFSGQGSSNSSVAAAAGDAAGVKMEDEPVASSAAAAAAAATAAAASSAPEVKREPQVKPEPQVKTETQEQPQQPEGAASAPPRATSRAASSFLQRKR